MAFLSGNFSWDLLYNVYLDYDPDQAVVLKMMSYWLVFRLLVALR